MNSIDGSPKIIRQKILDMAWQAKRAHLGGAMSCVEILVALYCGGILRYDVRNPLWEERDRFILSKGHGAMALYAVLNQIGLITDEELAGYHTQGHFLQVHPAMNPDKGLEQSGGSLGQGLPLAVGIAQGLRLKKNQTSRVFCLLGDGELNEGSVWEAAAFAAAQNLNRLTVIVDRNGLQSDGVTEKVLPFEPLADKWRSFGFAVSECDGHDLQQLMTTLGAEASKPRAVIAKTVKGKGLSFAENVPAWHYSELTRRMYEQGVQELQVTP